MLVDALVVDGLHGGGVRVGMSQLAVRVDALRAQLRQRLSQPALGVRMLVTDPDRSAAR